MGRWQRVPTCESPHLIASHPFFTGEEKIIDTEGRVDRFKAKFAAAEARKQELANKAKKKAAQKAKKTSSEQ